VTIVIRLASQAEQCGEVSADAGRHEPWLDQVLSQKRSDTARRLRLNTEPNSVRPTRR
jgi:hypothetical protein